MMVQTNDFLYISVDEKGFKCVRIPYKQREFSMLIILPDEKFGLKGVIEQLDVKTVENLKDINKFHDEHVSLTIPKLKFEYESKLNKCLRLLGVKDAFDESLADFSAMSTLSSGLFVSEAVHKAFIETNENGTEAAAATGLFCVPYCLSIPVKEPIRFTVDHPFVLMILFKSQTLFMGKVTSL